MTWVKGQSGNPGGKQSGKDAIHKIRKSIERGIDTMRDRDSKKVVGVVRLAENIRDALELDTVGTLKQLAPLLPKDLLIETSTGQAQSLTDDELAAIVASMTAKKLRDQAEDAEIVPESQELLEQSNPVRP